MVHTKIIATVGPASRDASVLRALIEAGVSVFRLNFSHGSMADHESALGAIRAAAGACGAHVAVMGDLAGPKIRLGVVAGGPRRLSEGQTVRVVRSPNPADPDALGTNYAALIDEVAVDQRVLIDDGAVRLRVRERRGDELWCVCEAGGVVSDRKGVNLPDTRLSLPALTPKDEGDVRWAVEHGLDYVALSFVRRPEDLSVLRGQIRRHGGDARIVAKVEKPEAVERLADVVDACDVLLVARGDLGVEMDVARVPLLQKEIVRQCRYAGRPVIIATQMLQSMVESATPTRAEVSDVANAILDGADAVMLSAETAVGRHVVEAVRVIVRIAAQTEPLLQRLAAGTNSEVLAAALRVTSAVTRGAALLAEDLHARLVAVWTEVGNTPQLLSKHRLAVPVVGLTPDERICRRMAMLYGVVPLQFAAGPEESEVLARLDRELVSRGLARQGDLTILASGAQVNQPGSTNNLMIHLVGRAAVTGGERA